MSRQQPWCSPLARPAGIKDLRLVKSLAPLSHPSVYRGRRVVDKFQQDPVFQDQHLVTAPMVNRSAPDPGPNGNTPPLSTAFVLKIEDSGALQSQLQYCTSDRGVLRDRVHCCIQTNGILLDRTAPDIYPPDSRALGTQIRRWNTKLPNIILSTLG